MSPALMSSDEFVAICKTLFGRGPKGYGWQKQMHEQTGTPTRTIQAWASGDNPIPPMVGWSLRMIVEKS